MNITTRSTARIGAALIAAIAGMAIAAPTAGASAGTRMLWYHWHPTARTLQAQTATFGSTAVLGLESMDDLAEISSAYGFGDVRPISELRAAEVSVAGAQLHKLLANAPSDERIRYVSPLGPRRRTMSMPNDPFLSKIDETTNLPYQWPFIKTHVDRALDYTKGDPSITVGVIDTGVANVPDLAGKIDGIWEFHDGVPTQVPLNEGNDEMGHGTAVASLIAANVDDHFGMAGFGGAAHVIAFRAGYGMFFFDNQIAIALTKLVSLGVRVVNLSVGGMTPSEPILVDAIHKAAAAGVLIVAATGNSSSSRIAWPAADLQPAGGGRGYGLAVGATTAQGDRADFSNYGDKVSVVAPGTFTGGCSGVLAALPSASIFDETCLRTWSAEGGARYVNIPGTSFSAPQVAGVAALVLAARPDLTNYQVAAIIKQSAHRAAGTGWTPELGCGELDAGAALELAISYSAESARRASEGPCSVAGNEPPQWPIEKSQTITFPAIADKTFGDPDFRVNATASSGLPLSYSATGNCTVTDAIVHLTGPGACSIVASQPGNKNFNPAPNASRTFMIAAASPLAVRALAASGRWAGNVRLPFSVGVEKKAVTSKIVVQRNGTTVAQLERGFAAVEPDTVYALTWHAPKAKTSGVYRFCVTLSDVAGNKSGRSCASIRLR